MKKKINKRVITAYTIVKEGKMYRNELLLPQVIEDLEGYRERIKAKLNAEKVLFEYEDR